jgi:hypothetical protein
MKNGAGGFWGLAFGIGLVMTAAAAWAVQVPDNQLLPDPEKTLGDPVVYIQLVPGKEKETSYLEMKKQKQCILGYRELSLLDLNTDHPILMTWTYNQKTGQVTKALFNWKEIDSIQILDPKIKVHE